VLRAANSAASGSATRITTVQESLTRIGTAQLMALAVAIGARPHLMKSVPAYGLEEGALWRHAVASAVAAETMPGFCTTEAPPETFTAALLHDVGKQVMGRFLTEETLHFIAQARDVDHLSWLEAETRILGIHHGELGGIIAQHWQLPFRVVQGIIHHHDPDEDKDIVCDFVCMANQIAKRIEAGLEGGEFEMEYPPETVVRLGLPVSELENLFQAATARFAQVSLRYNAV